MSTARVLSLLLATLALPAHGQTAASYPESVLELTINQQQERHTLLVRRAADGGLLIAANDLQTLRLRRPDNPPLVVAGTEYFHFGPDTAVSVRIDEASQTAELSAAPDRFLPTSLGYASVAEPSLTPARPGGFLNYDLTANWDERDSLGSGLLEAGIFGAAGVVTHSLASRHDPGQRTTRRLDTTWTRDFPTSVATLRVGDAITATGAWGRAVRFGGIQFGTNFRTQPTLVTTPLLVAQGSAIVPSTVEVFVNGRRAAREEVPPGPFTLDRLPAISGAGELEVVVTDILGRQQVISQPFYSGSALLRADLDEYSFELGSLRRDYGERSNQYSDVIAAGTWRHGFSDLFTGELHAELQGNGQSALGFDAAWQMGTFGVVSGTGAIGGDDTGTGWLGGLGFERSARSFSFFLRSQYISREFAQLASEEILQRPRQRSFVGAGYDLPAPGRVSLAWGRQSYWSASSIETLGLSYSVELGSAGYLSFNVSHLSGEEGDTELLLSWTRSFGERRTSSAYVRSSTRDYDTDLELVGTLQRAVPPGSGSGYLINGSTTGNYLLGYSLQGRNGNLDLEAAERNDQRGWRASAYGGLAITGAGVMTSRSLTDSFAVVQVADYADLTVYLENQPIGVTDDHGRVLIDRLRPYEANGISLDPKEIPLDATLQKASMKVTPAYRSGPLIAFPIERELATLLKLALEDGRPVPPGARVIIRGEQFPVARDGVVYLTGIEHADHVSVEWPSGRCIFAFQRPATEDPLPDLGQVPCTAEPE